MCGRFTLQISPEMLAEIFGLAEVPVYPARYNIAPTQQILVVRQTADYHNHLDYLRWGLIPSWTKELKYGEPLINARSETVAEKPAFRHAIRYRRCLIPANGFYEWERRGDKKIPLYVHLKDGSPMVFAGIWENWKSPEGQVIESCSMLTTAANRLIEPLHDRQPVVLHPAEYGQWLDRDVIDPEKLKRFYQPYPADLMEIHPVSQQVNNPRNEGPELIAPIS